MGCVASTAPGECLICFSDTVGEYYMWPCGHGNVCPPCATALNAETIGGVIVRNVHGRSLYYASNQNLLRCPVCRTDGFHHRIYRV